MTKATQVDIAAFIRNPANLWPMRVIGRQAGLPLLRSERDNATRSDERALLDQAYKLELQIIRAAKAEDEALWNSTEAESKAVFNELKLLG